MCTEKQKDALESHKLQIKALELNKEIFNLQIDRAIEERKSAIQNILNTPLPLE